MTHPDKGTPANRHSAMRKTAMLLFGGFLLVIAVGWGLHWLRVGRFAVSTDDAYVNGNLVQLMSRISGTVTEIDTDEALPVVAGQVIVRLDPADRQIALAQARANLAWTVRKVRKLFENAKTADALLVLRREDLRQARLDLKRRKGLREANAVSREEYQHYLTALKVAEAQFAATLYAARSARAGINHTRPDTHPLVEQAKARFREAWLNAGRTVIRAPVTGYVAKRHVQAGQQISANTPLLAIIPLDEIWVDANYRETQLGRLRAGQPVTLTADAWPGVTYHGHIRGLNAGTGAVFSLLPPQNATGNWIKIVQRLPVRIVPDAEELKKYPLLPGLSMHVTTNVHKLDGSWLAPVPMTGPLYATGIFQQALAGTDAEIKQILAASAADREAG